MTGSVPLVPLPRRPPEPGGTGGPGDPVVRTRNWYEKELGWATVPGALGEPLRLVTGVRFDVLDVPAEAGAAALRHLGPGSPVALCGERMRLLVAAGGAEELPGLLEWLEWGALTPDLRAMGTNGHVEAPPVPEQRADGAGRMDVPPQPLQGAAVWLRPPEPGCEVEASLPTLSAVGGVGNAPDLVRLVDTVATHCHRIRLRRACAGPSVVQPLAFS
ncbi:SCO3374 family protein [Streptomyces brasiliensis]|uniref:Proline-rich protein n=1 Tax=Streptomyces brasiliensis TaxID=1954 RepID=A0A917L7M4_9ACTN|nr:SCO3374 family protein [Streptomyces brasiliensis]GGJ46267.1 hypothetical protein GCM10010121_067020 [Streptomyces brasiliensis]